MFTCQGSCGHDSGTTQVEKQPNFSIVQVKCLICLDSSGSFQCHARLSEDKGGLIDVRFHSIFDDCAEFAIAPWPAIRKIWYPLARANKTLD